MNPEIVVIGSLNMDLVVQAPRRPNPGETLFGTGFATVPGGKGANQAVAAARLGARVAMFGRIGDDIFGSTLRTGLEQESIDTRHLLVTPGVPTGTALITVDEQAENSITVVPGANNRLTPEDIGGLAQLVPGAKVVLLQLEIPLETVMQAAKLARRHGLTVILDPAPAPAENLPDELLSLVDIIVPNETEASILTGRSVSDARTARLAATDLLHRGVSMAIVKLGARGALLAAGNQFEHIPGFRVEAVDSTAAGDAFAGALAVGLVEGKSMHEAVVWANKVGALSATRFGAQTSMPSRLEADQFEGVVGD